MNKVIVELPESEEIPESYNDNPEVQCLGVWSAGDSQEISAWTDGTICEGDGAEWTPKDVRDFAAALLAAAAVVEKDQAPDEPITFGYGLGYIKR